MILTGRTVAGSERPMRFYMRKRDEIALASVRLGTIEYAYRPGKGLAAAFCTVGRAGGAPAANGTLGELDALFGPHEIGPTGAPSWRGAHTLAVLVQPREIGGSAPLLALFATPIEDEDAASAVREWNLRSAGSALTYRLGPEIDAPRPGEHPNEQFRLDLQRERENSKVPR
jgi:hypothetical protein